MTKNEKFFKDINDSAKKTNTIEEKTIEYSINYLDYGIDPYSDSVFMPQDYNYLPEQYKNEFNTHGYRSDNFLKNHNGEHILFAGCSQTFGFGLEKQEMWSKLLYDKINKDIACSGYFNLSVSGSGIQFIISNIFKYMKNFGNPNCIFLNLPTQLRFIGFSSKQNSYKKIALQTKDQELQKFFCLLNYHYYLMLEQYCNTNNIKLYSVSWHMGEPKYYNTNDFFSIFKTFIHIDQEKMNKEIIKNEHNYNSDYYYYARDGVHDGFGYNIWFANFLYDKYLEGK